MNIERFSALIDGFYSAALEPERWPEAAAETASFFEFREHSYSGPRRRLQHHHIAGHHDEL